MCTVVERLFMRPRPRPGAQFPTSTPPSKSTEPVIPPPVPIPIPISVLVGQPPLALANPRNPRTPTRVLVHKTDSAAFCEFLLNAPRVPRHTSPSIVPESAEVRRRARYDQPPMISNTEPRPAA